MDKLTKLMRELDHGRPAMRKPGASKCRRRSRKRLCARGRHMWGEVHECTRRLVGQPRMRVHRCAVCKTVQEVR